MTDELELFELELKSDKDKVFAISVVENPAMESNFMKFSDEIQTTHFFQNEDQRILTGVAMIPNKKILRFNKDTKEYYNITISENTIKDIAQKFFKEKFNSNTTLEHESKVDNTFYFESWIVEDPNNDKSNALGFKDITKGTWFVSLKIEDEELWKKVKTGKYNGFSIEGFFTEKKIKKEEQMNIFKKVSELFANAKTDLLKLQIVDLELVDGTMISFDDETKEVKDSVGELLADGVYTLKDETTFEVKEGKKVEEEVEKIEEVLEETPVEEVEEVEEVADLKLKDGSVIYTDENQMIRYKESDDILLDGVYTLENDSTFEIKEGLIVSDSELELNRIKEEFSSTKIIFEKELNEEKLKVEELSNKIIELNAKIVELSNEPATSKTITNDVKEKDFSTMSLAERTSFNIRKNLKK